MAKSEMTFPRPGIWQQVLQPESAQSSSHQWVQQPSPTPSPHVNSWVLWSNPAWSAPCPGSHLCHCVLWTDPAQPAPRLNSYIYQQVILSSLV